MKALIVDDEIHIARLFSYTLAKQGYVVESASDGQLALEKIETFQPDIIILDLMLPKISGLDVLQRIRANPESVAIPVVVLSATPFESMEERVKNAGATAHWTKPISPSSLVKKLSELEVASKREGE